jgi:hypothetical protein
MANKTIPAIQTNEGNVGIGSTAPGAKLDVVGNVNIDGSSFHRIANDSIITAPSDHGLVAYYGFDEGSSLSISDKTGRNNTSASGSLTYTTTAIRGTALDGFGSNANLVVVPDSTDFDFGTGDFAVSLWCRPNSSFAGFNNTLIEIGLYTAGILIRPQANLNTIEVYAQNSLITAPAIVWAANVWYHIVVTRVSSVLNVYSNGTRISSVANSSNIQVASAGYIGRSAHAVDQLFYGIIDEVKIYKGKGLDYGEVRGQYLSRGDSTLVAPIFSNTNGYVGIGTTSLGNPLEVYGTSMDPSLTPSAASIFNVNSLGVELAVGRMVTSPFSLWLQGKHATVGGSLTYPIVLNPLGGNVGIGLTNPAFKLHVTETNGDEVQLGTIGSNQIVGGRDGGSFGIATKASSNGNMILSANSAMYFRTNTSNESAYIGSNGNFGINTTNPTKRLHVKGSLYWNLNDSNADEHVVAIARSVAAAAGSFTEIGALAASANSIRATIEIFHHDCGTIEYSMFELIANFYTGATTDWVQLPSRTQAHYAGDRNGVVVDARLATTGGAVDLRFRSLGGACAAMAVFARIKANTVLTETTATGTGATVAGLLGFNRYEFPVTNDRFKGTYDGLFIKNNGFIGIGSTNPQSKLSISGTTAAIALSFGNTVANNPLILSTYSGWAGIGMDQSTAGLRLVGDYSSTTTPLVDVGSYIGGAVSHANWKSSLKVLNNSQVSIGGVTPLSLLAIGGSGSTTAASGITFGNDAQANLYRAGEDTIKTDGSLNVAGLIYNANSAYYSSLSKSTSANWGQYTVVLGNASYSSQLIQVSVNGGNLVWAGTFLASCHLSYRPNETWINVKLLECATYNCGNDDVTLLALSNSTTSQYGVPALVLKTNGAISAGGGTGAANNITVTVNGPSPNEFVLSSSSWTQPYTYQIATSANTKQIYVTESGNVGIGINSPSSQANYKFLQVNGTNSAVIETMVGGARIGGFDSTASALYVGTIGNFPVIFRTQVDEKMRIAAGGNVGIATNNPGDRLHVNLNSGENILANIAYNGISANNKVSFRLSELGTPLGEFSAVRDGTSYQVKLQTVNNQPLSFGTNSVTRMVIDTAGNVGISSTSPGAKLDIGGTLRTSGNILSHKTASYTTSYPGISSFGADATDSNITYYDTGKNVLNTNFRGIVWTGKHYIFTDYANNRAYFYDNNFTQITNAYGYYFVTLPIPSGFASPHGAAWDGRYLWLIVYAGGNLKIVGYDLDSSTQTATIIAESAALPLNSTYDVEYADGHLYFIRAGTLYIYKWNGSSIDYVAAYAGAAGTIDAQAITYDGSYLWATQNGVFVYKIGLDGTPLATITSGFPPDTCGWAWNGSNIVSFDFSARDIYIINTTRLRIDTQKLALMGGNVGIGTTNPSALLQIDTPSSNGNGQGLRINRPSAGTHYHSVEFTTNGTVDWSIGQNSNDAFEVYENGAAITTRFTIKEGGNIGIGTVSPATLLSVGGAGSTSAASGITFGADASANLYRDTTSRIRTDGAFISSSYIFAGTYLQTSNGNIFPANFSTDIVLNVGNAAANNWETYPFTLKKGGYVGLGTNSPSGKLHIVSSVAGETVLRTDGTNGTLFSVVDDLSDSLMSVNNSAGLPVLEVFADDRVVAGQYGSGDFVLINNKIGIGTSNPANKLTVIGGASIGSSTYNTSAPSNGLIVQGNVGIGTTSPAHKLQLGTLTSTSTATPETLSLGGTYSDTGGSNPKLRIWTDGTYSMGLGVSSNQLDYILGRNIYDHVFYAEGSRLMTIKGGGNVGIGTTAPVSTLDVDNSVVNIPILNLGGGEAGNAVSDLYVLNSYNNNTGVGYAAKVIGVNISGSLTATNIPVQRTIWGGVTSATAIALGTDGPRAGTQDNAFQIWTTNDGVAGTPLTQKFSVSSAGDVGIGIVTPTDKIQISGGGISFTTSTGLAVPMLGITATNLAYIGPYGTPSDGNAPTVVAFNLGPSVQQTWFYASGNIAMVLNKQGRLHIGNNINTPNSLLSVGPSSSTTAVSGMCFGNDASANLYRSATSTIKTDGNLVVAGTTSLNGHIYGNKTVALTTASYTTVLTVNLTAHTSCYVKIGAFGDWGNHSAVAFVSELFIQNGDNAGYGEPGTIITVHDNTAGAAGDKIDIQIVDPAAAGTQNFLIQLKLISATSSTNSSLITYHVMGQQASVT